MRPQRPKRYGDGYLKKTRPFWTDCERHVPSDAIENLYFTRINNPVAKQAEK